jgi:hypothetical protein
MESVGAYELVRRVAQSSSGSVWQGRDHDLDRDVALKQVPVDAGDAAQRVRSEARLLANFDHPNIVAVYGLVESAGDLWLVEEWVEGASLPAVLAAADKLSAPQSVGIVRGALQGLAYTHRRGVVHGDISPSNILFDSTGTSKLIDFGLAVTSGVLGGGGTPGFLSPEAMQGLPVTPRSDVYSAAAVLAMLLRGRPLFEGVTAESVVAVQLKTARPRLETIPSHTRDVLARALSRQATDRFADAEEFLQALEEAAERSYGADWLSHATIAGIVAGAGSAAVTVAATAISGGAAATSSQAAVAANQLAPVAQSSNFASQAVASAPPVAPTHVQSVINVAGRAVPRKAVAISAGATAAVVAAVIAVVVTTHGGSPTKTAAATPIVRTSTALPPSVSAAVLAPARPTVYTKGTATLTVSELSHCSTCDDHPGSDSSATLDNGSSFNGRVNLSFSTGQTNIRINGQLPDGTTAIAFPTTQVQIEISEPVLVLADSSPADTYTGNCTLTVTRSTDSSTITGTLDCPQITVSDSSTDGTPPAVWVYSEKLTFQASS